MSANLYGQILSKSSRLGTQREYETVVILRPSNGKPQILEIISRLHGVIGEREGRLNKIDSWGMRILSYPIKHERKGIYLYWRYTGGSDLVQELERHMRLSDQVLRFYTVRVDDDVDPNAKPSEITEDLLQAVAEPGPDPEELQRKAEEEARKRAETEAADQTRRAAQRAQHDDDNDDNDDNDDEGDE